MHVLRCGPQSPDDFHNCPLRYDTDLFLAKCDRLATRWMKLNESQCDEDYNPNVVEDYSFISEMGFEDDDYDRCVAYIRGELADEAPAVRPRKLSDAEVDEILGDEDDEGDESEDFQEHRRNCIACTRDYPRAESDEGDEGDQAEFCEVGEHYTTKEMMWPNFADCFDCASAKEYAEQRGISVELAEEIADGNDAEICLFIRCPNGNTLALYVSRCDEFTEVKELIFDKTRNTAANLPRQAA